MALSSEPTRFFLALLAVNQRLLDWHDEYGAHGNDLRIMIPVLPQPAHL